MIDKRHKVGFIGLGYAGFPMMCLFSSKYETAGFDLSFRRVTELQSGIDHCGDVPEEDIQKMLDNGTVISNEIQALKDCNIFIVTVPTPVDKNNEPDMSYLVSASREAGSVLKKGDIVIYESTVYPGATEEVCVPVLEETSGLKYNKDFFVGYSPERINPGDREHTPQNVVKVTSGSTKQTAQIVKDLYAGVLGEEYLHSVSSIKVAEACKIVENTQRDINIAFINEIAKILNAMDIDTNEVVDAMDTKWNALKFRPGLVGGHCIGVDPYYLIEKANSIGIEPKLIKTGRKINISMSEYIATKVTENLKGRLKNLKNAKILLLGFAFKENCPDVRNTKVYDVYRALKRATANIEIYDPMVDNELAHDLYGINVKTNLHQLSHKRFDAIVVCVPHAIFQDIDFKHLLNNRGFIFDLKGAFNNEILKKKEIEVKTL